jgi:PAS domain S-box-containing protein
MPTNNGKPPYRNEVIRQDALSDHLAAVCICDKAGRIIQFNSRASAIWGVSATPREACSDVWRACTVRDDGGNILSQDRMPIAQVLRTGEPVRDSELMIEHPDGSQIAVLVSVDPILDERGALAGAVACAQDITKQKQAQQIVETQECRYRELLDALPAAIYTTDGAGRITFYNKAAAELAGREPRLGIDEWCVTWKLYWPDGRPLAHDECPMAIAIKENRAVRGAEAIAERPDGTRVPFVPYPVPLCNEAGEVTGAVNMLVDISANKEIESERQRLLAELTALNETLEQRVEERTHALTNEIIERRFVEQQLHQLQKTEALGQLTGGIAHDFNNLLTAVLGNLDMIGMKAKDPGVRQHAHAASRAATRGATLTQQLLAFSRKQRLDRKPTNINELVTGTGEMLLRTLGGTVRIELALAHGLWPALIDANQTEAAILNLAINARDAMPDGGTLTIETANLRVGQLNRTTDLPSADYIMVAVTDTGSGMSEEVKAKAFDPFFTTKDVGKGSGLGLSQVYGLARQSGGTAVLESTPGEGTTVRIYLPRAHAEAAESLSGTDFASDPSPLKTAGLRVLVVDDDDDVRSVMVMALERFDYQVTAAASGAAAIAAVEHGTFDIVVMDYAMPEMTGAQAGRMLQERWPALPVLYVSGYAKAQALDDDIADGNVLRKPFLASDLDATIRRILNKRTAATATEGSNVVRLRAGGSD